MMRRAIARGRVFPQSYSTDRRYGRLSLKATTLYPLMWANADDQGRLSGDPEEIKYFACPNIDHITKADIPKILEELHQNSLINVYNTSQSVTIQILDWWHVQRLQWAWPSRYPPPQGWEDKLRYKRGTKEVVTQNWPSSGESQNSTQVNPQVNSPETSGEPSGETPQTPPLTTPLEKEKEKERGRGRGNIPGAPAGAPGGRSPPSLTGLSTDEIEILQELTACFKKEFGRVPAESPYKIIPREPTARESAQLRDLAKELCVAGGCPLDYIDQSFREAAGQVKMHISYVRAVLLDWLGVPRAPP